MLIVASLSFYASWGLPFLAILAASIGFNYGARQLMLSELAARRGLRTAVLIAIIVVDLAALFAFKYFDFFLGTLHGLGLVDFGPIGLAVPLGMSFYTFQEITLAVDAWRGASRTGFGKYLLFIVFFPHLIAGPRSTIARWSRNSRGSERDSATC